MINQSRIIALAQKLIRANSENYGAGGSGSPGSHSEGPKTNEKAAALIVKKELEECGFEVNLYAFENGRTNAVGVLKGKGSSRQNANARSLLLTPHLDTVPAGDISRWAHNPFGAEIADGKIYGRGASDCKCNIAVCLEAARIIRENNIALDYDLIIAATADEEAGSALGLVPLLEKGIIKPAHALVMDGGMFKIEIMQKGVLRLNAIIYGKKAHGAYPWKGENAIEKAAEIILNLKTYKFDVAPHPLVHPPTINIGLIKGGTGINIVPDECEFTIDLRFLPGMNAADIIREIKALIEKTTTRYKLDFLCEQPAYHISEKSVLATKLKSALKKNGIMPEIAGCEGATVMAFFQKFGIPAISFGVGPDNAHQTDEYVEIEALEKGAKVLLDFLKAF